jgi:Uma2 family endonuclease
MFHAPVDLFLESGVFIPDIMVVCDPAKKTPRGIEGVPDLVVEILSPSTAQKDWTHKRWAYQMAGIPEYLIVDPDERVAVMFCLEAGRYQEVTHVEWGAVMSLLNGKISITLGS